MLGLKRSDLLNWSWEGRVVGEGGGEWDCRGRDVCIQCVSIS